MSEKICVVIGVGPGIGLAVAKRFGKEGYHLVLMARRAEALEGYIADCESAGFKAVGFTADVSDTASIATAFARVKAELGNPEVLIYNPSILREGVPSMLDPEQVVADFRINVVGGLICAQQVIPTMKENSAGTILFTGGGLALNPAPPYSSLAIGKAGLRNLTYSLHAELKEAGIHVATVTVAGFVKTGTHFDPDLIAEEYWKLHAQEEDQWEQEILYKA